MIPPEAYGWSAGWQAELEEVAPGATAGRVVRHDGVALALALPGGTEVVDLTRRLRPEPAVGDWVAVADGQPLAVLPRRSLLRRRAAGTDAEQVLAANVDLVLVVCGADRPLRHGRILRALTLARDAGAEPVLVLSKATLADDPEALAQELADAHPGVAVLVTSAREGVGLEGVTAAIDGGTVVLLGESGAGKSTLVNALAGEDVASTGRVRTGDAKGRHTTTARKLYPLPGGGTVIDTPGLRAVGLWVDPEAVTEAFADIEGLAADCRFSDCAHSGEPGCAVSAAVAAGDLPAVRVTAWRDLRDEAEALARQAEQAERSARGGRRQGRRGGRRG